MATLRRKRTRAKCQRSKWNSLRRKCLGRKKSNTILVDDSEDSEDSQGFISTVKLLNEPYTISHYKPHETKFEFYLQLSHEEQDIYNWQDDNSQVQILLRVGQIVDNGILWDKVPEGFLVKINKTLPIVKVTSPFNIGKCLRVWPLSKSILVKLSWLPQFDSSYILKVDWLMIKNPSLFGKFIKAQTRPPDYIFKKIKGSTDIKILSQEVSLLCPLTMNRIKIPAQGSDCDHINCFDGETFLKFNLAKPKWTCPICRKFAYPNNIIVDGFWVKVLEECLTNSVVIHPDGTWTPSEKKDKVKSLPSSSEIIIII